MRNAGQSVGPPRPSRPLKQSQNLRDQFPFFLLNSSSAVVQLVRWLTEWATVSGVAPGAKPGAAFVFVN
jgi:hypothetical protein